MCFPFPRYVRTDGLCPSLHSSSLLSQQVSSCLPFFFSCSFQDWPLTLNKIGEGPQRRRLFCSCIVAHLHIYHGRPDLFAVYFYYSPPSWLWVIRRKGNREVNWYMDHLERGPSPAFECSLLLLQCAEKPTAADLLIKGVLSIKNRRPK